MLETSTQIYPPKFCSFKDPSDSNFPAYLTDKTNLLAKLDYVNLGIGKINTEAIELGELEGMMELHSFMIGLGTWGATRGNTE